MDSKAFHICPFCQATSPVADARCARCRRSLAGLTLPTYGSEVDKTLSGREPQPLVDLPLRENAVVASAARTEPAVERVAAAPPLDASAFSAPRRSSRGGMIGVAAAVFGVTLVGGWLVLGQAPRRAGETDTPAATSPAPPSTVDTASVPTIPAFESPAPVAPVATPRPAAATQRTANTEAMRPAPPPPVMANAPTARRAASRPERRPAAEPVEDEGPVPPDIDMDPAEPARGGAGSRAISTAMSESLSCSTRAQNARKCLAPTGSRSAMPALKATMTM